MAVHDLKNVDLLQPSALRPQGWGVEVEVISSDLTDEQRALVVQVKQLSAVVHMAGFERAKRLRLLRDSFPIGRVNNPDTAARMGWADFLRREFDTNVKDTNHEIAAVEAIEGVLVETEGGAPLPGILDKIGSTHLSEIGRGSTPAIRRKVWDKLLDGKLKLSQRTIRAEVKLLNSDGGKVKLRVPAPPKVPGASKLPVRDPAAGGRTWSIAKWTKSGTPQGERMEKELNYLAGSDTRNQSFADGLKKLRQGSSGSGKLLRVLALVEALHAECKAVSDRYQLENEKARDWKRYMTVWQHHWADTDQLDMHELLKQIVAEMAEASRHFEITGQLSWSNDVQLEE
jgi:hypothetical protein